MALRAMVMAGCMGMSAIALGQTGSDRHISVNGELLTGRSLQRLEALERAYGIRLRDGFFWYDNRSGAAGVWNGPAAAFLPAGLGLGGPMPAGCSGGGTGVFVNGRELHPYDVYRLSQLGPVYPGRYWVDANGDFGYEYGPRLGNLVMFARAARARAALQQNHNGGRAKYAMDGIIVNGAGFLERNGSSATW